MAAQTTEEASTTSQPSLHEARPSPKPRLYYLDNLRTTLIIGVVLGHLSITYGIMGDWYYMEGGETSLVVNVLALLIVAIGSGFAMGLFFTIAGYFTPPAYDRKGFKGFLVDRLIRLGIPWLIYEIVINPFIHYAVDVHGGNCTGSLYDCQFQGSFWQYLKGYPQALGSFGDGPVWFLEVLLLFSVFYALWRVIPRPAPSQAPGKGDHASAVPGNAAIALFALLIGLITFVVRIWAKVLHYYEPFHFELAHFPQYIALFVAGTWVYRGDWLARFSDRQARTWGWVALGCVLTLPAIIVWAGALSGSLDERGAGGVNWLSLAYSLWEGFLCVSMVITVLAWFRRRFNHQGRLARAMSRSTFAVYVLHPAIIVPLALALSGIQMNLSFKYLIVAPFAVGLCYLVCFGLLKIPAFRKVFG